MSCKSNLSSPKAEASRSNRDGCTNFFNDLQDVYKLQSWLISRFFPDLYVFRRFYCVPIDHRKEKTAEGAAAHFDGIIFHVVKSFYQTPAQLSILNGGVS